MVPILQIQQLTTCVKTVKRGVTCALLFLISGPAAEFWINCSSLTLSLVDQTAVYSTLRYNVHIGLFKFAYGSVQSDKLGVSVLIMLRVTLKDITCHFIFFMFFSLTIKRLIYDPNN